MSWSTVRADQFCTLITDGTHDSPKPQQSGWKLITSKHLKGHYIDFDSANWISEADYLKVISRSAVEQWDILFSMIGTIGNIYLEKNPHVEYACKNMGIFKFSGNKENALWMYYYLRSPQAKAYIQTHLRGSTQAYVPLGGLREMPVPVPPQTVRNEIIAILRPIDEKIECNNAINDNLQQQLFSLYENMATASPCLKEYTLSNLCDFQEGYVNPPQTHPEYFDGEVKWLRAVDINESFIIETSRTLTKAGFESAKKSALLFEPNTIAISKSGTIGRLGIIADYMCGNRAVINIAPHDTNMLAFIYCFLKSKQREFPDMAVGSVQKNLYVSLLEPLSVSIPDNESLTAFNAVGASILGMIHNNCVENTDLANLRDTILPKLMSGEIDVSSVLL